MILGTKALYNALRFRDSEEGVSSKTSTSPKELWKISDYRSFSIDTLFTELAKLGRTLDKETFLAYAEECDSPEELVDLLTPDSVTLDSGIDDLEVHDHLYLILLEMWRRFVPERPSVSILCDELDIVIFAYDTGKSDGESVLSALEPILEVIQSNVDEGLSVTEAFSVVESNCAHDLKRFFTDFILDLLDEGAIQDAEELFERLKPLFEANGWTLLLQARFMAPQSTNDAHVLLKKALKLGPHELAFYAEAVQALRWLEDDLLVEPILLGALESIQSWADVEAYLHLLLDLATVYDLESFEPRIQEMIQILEGQAQKGHSFSKRDVFFDAIQDVSRKMMHQIMRSGVDLSQSQAVRT